MSFNNCDSCSAEENEVDILLKSEEWSFFDDINEATGQENDNLCNICADAIEEEFKLELGY